ncbi:hypothetical protein VP01_404g3, partial [Puccinia sorghi]
KKKRKILWMKRGPIMKLILMILMKEKRIWLKKTMMTRMARIPLIVQVNNPTRRRHLPQTPVLLSLAKDYLAVRISVGDFEVKEELKWVSSAADVCSSCCGSLNPQTIDRFLSSHMWLKEGIQLTGKFEKAQKNVKDYVDFSQKTSKK